MHRLIALILVVLLSIVSARIASGDDHYLNREILTAPTTGAGVVTSAPLEPYVVYRLTFSSPFDLTDVVEQRIDIRLGDAPAKILDFDTGLFDVVNHIYTLYQGTGEKLTIQLKAANPSYNSSRLQEFARHAPSIEVTITRRPWWQDYRGTGIHPTIIRIALLIISVTIIGYIAYRHGPRAFNDVISQFNGALQGDTNIPTQRRRRVHGRVRIIRDNEEEETHEP